MPFSVSLEALQTDKKEVPSPVCWKLECSSIGLERGGGRYFVPN